MPMARELFRLLGWVLHPGKIRSTRTTDSAFPFTEKTGGTDHTRIILYGVALLGAKINYVVQETELHLLYSGSETYIIDMWTDEINKIDSHGAGITLINIPGIYPPRNIVEACGDHTNGSYQRSTLPDGTQAQELTVKDFHLKSTTS